MNTRNLSDDDRFNLIVECRRSGLTDRQWCAKMGIHFTTFYRWIARFRERGFPNVPEYQDHADLQQQIRQEVVKLPVLPEMVSPDTCSICEATLEHNDTVCNPVTAQFTPVAEVSCNGITLKISNDIHPGTAELLLKYVRGAL